MAVCQDRLSCIYAAICIGLIWFIIVPFEIYATINMLKYRHHPGVRARYPMIAMASAIFAMLHSLICEQFYYLSSGFNIDILRQPPVPYIANIIFPPLLLTMITIALFRIYLIHYNINYVVIQSTYDWQSLLCDKVSANDFYSRHHTTLGNWKYVSRYFIAYIVIAVVAEITITISEHPQLLATSHNLSQLVYIFWILICTLIGAILYAKTPPFDDAYFVRKEVKYILYYSLFCISLYIITFLVSDAYPIFNVIRISPVTLYNFGGVVISQYIVLKKIKQKDNDNALDHDYGRLKLKHPQGQFSLTSLKVIRTLSHSLEHKSKNPLLIPSRQLFNVLIASRVCIPYFVKHLLSEFCVENLLCFIELIQWLYNITEKKFQMFDIRPLPDINFTLSSAIPISSANKRDEIIWDWQISILIIFKKYIHSSAEYQVNLPYEIQNAFANLTNLLTIKQQIQSGTYTFKNKPTIQVKKKRVHFWEKRSNTKSSKSTLDKSSSYQSCKNSNLDDIEVALATKAKSADHRSSNISEATTLFPNASVPNSSDPKHALKIPGSTADLTVNVSDTSLKKTKSADNPTPIPADVNLSPTHASAPALSSIYKRIVENDATKQNDIDSAPAFEHDNNELVVLDIDYLYGDDYKDPQINEEISRQDTFTWSRRGTSRSSTLRKKLGITIQKSLHKSLVKVNELIKQRQAPKTPTKSVDKSSVESVEDVPNEEYFKELKVVQQAKNLTAVEFVSITCRVLHSILQLNYQSVTRFKRSKEYIKMIEAVNLDTLVSKYGEKGVSGLKTPTSPTSPA